jgi:hypothetical protein
MAQITPKPHAPHSSVERRKHPRATASLPISIGQPGGRLAARVRDISKSGVCFYSPQPFPEMSLLRMEFEIPSPTRQSVQADGAVVRCIKSPTGEYEIAVYFMAITEMSKDAIGNFVAAHHA